MISCRRLGLIVAVGLALAACDSSSKSAAPSSTRRPTTTTIASTTIATVTTKTRSTPTTVPRAPFFADPNPAALGERVTFSGRGCSPNADVVIIADLERGTVRGRRPHADGSWSTSAVLADNSPVGTVDVFAECEVGKVLVDFKPLPLEITTYRNLLVEPGTTVRAGTTLALTATGGCAPTGFVTVDLRDTKFATLTQTGLTRQPSGRFTGTIRIPPGTPRGTYTLYGECTEFRSYLAYWPRVTITVN